MLILTRRESELLYLGENITVAVTKVKGKQVKLSIEAPTKVNVVRGEIRHRGKRSPNSL